MLYVFYIRQTQQGQQINYSFTNPTRKMSSGNYKTDKINQMLRQRKAQRKKVDMYRNKRIKHKFHKLLDEEQQHQQQQASTRNQQDVRKIQFYNSVFGPSTSAAPRPSNIRPTKTQKPQLQQQPNKQQMHSQVIQSRKQQTHMGKYKAQTSELKQKQKSVQKKWENKNKQSSQKIHPKYSNNKRQFTSSQKQSQQQRRSRQNQIGEKLTEKVDKLKQRKKKLIRKMDERNKKGQPIMNNYVKYALTKLEQTMAKQKLKSHQQATQNKYNQNSKFNSNTKSHSFQKNNKGDINFRNSQFGNQHKYRKFVHKN